ncbi:MAG: hypothetical protein ACK51V_00655 [bacterium]|jgi:hypothetical protein|nr:hypothetical protein [Rhodocyclaceae bacterium]MCA3025314.1 hypothetical protein [Rhodocyclaceae bacterium]MCA3029574.1 hypothetical protein [Rhodocyclaceae bacterium]MCA3034692.1 hypothetical protein [Rhodocyclaceae bacterium]MCA3037803.1 hypothetical protein [Rhodocyclaceae bacterium]
MASRGRKANEEPTEALMMRLPKPVKMALERLVATGFYGRTKQEVLMTLAVREMERVADRNLVEKLTKLSTE